MRLLIEIDRSADGRYEGTVLSASGPVPIAFSGTLELLKVLEDSTSNNKVPRPPQGARHG